MSHGGSADESWIVIGPKMLIDRTDGIELTNDTLCFHLWTNVADECTKLRQLACFANLIREQNYRADFYVK